MHFFVCWFHNLALRANRETAGKQYGAAMVLLNKQWHMVPLPCVCVPFVRVFALKCVCLFVCVCGAPWPLPCCYAESIA